ncbi:MAG: aromatic acid/H+ symport family MFS transporter, partial [Rhodospirillales bacterium]|nr:aromatic acid/H+ symport family MFS transporter [Rhodospirillales bacterium]
GRFHARVLFWCTLIILFDGYDLVIFGVVLPKLMEQWQLSPVEAGALGSSALFGMMIGAMGFGMLADRLGRKTGIIVCVVLFSTVTVITGMAATPLQFAVLRFAAGLGIGGVMPNVVALLTEYAPRRSRSTMVAVMFSGYAIGGMTSAALGIWIVPAFGWPAMFYLAAAPLLLLPLMIRALPESAAVLLRRGREGEVRRVLAAVGLGRADNPDAVLMAPAEAPARAPLVEVFRERRALSTLMFWTAFFMCLLMVYALGFWLPKLMTLAGYGLKSSLAFLMVLNMGAIIGAIGGAWVADRSNLRAVLLAYFGTAAVSLGLLGFDSPTWVLYALIAIAGATTIGSQTLLYAYAAQFYPAAIRSTGIGWASGIGRTGAILGPLLAGGLLALALPHHLNFAALAIPSLIAATAVFWVNGRIGALTAQTAAATEPGR